MKLIRTILLAGVFSFLSFAQDAQHMRGFLTREIAEEQSLEKQAQAVPDTGRLRKYMNFMAAEPHNAGSPRSKVVAEYVLGHFKEWGLDAHIEEFEALMPTPTVREVEMVSPKHFTAKLKEPVVPEDPNSGDAHQLPTYNSYGASGDVVGQVVYVNFGVPQDYDWLVEHGIDVQGKIVIARYGKSWRGIKVKVAAEHGAIACLIYSDPHEDGYYDGDVFPKGPMRPADGVQRGSVLGHATVSGRSAFTWLGVGERLKALIDGGSEELDEDSGTAYFLCGCATDFGTANRAAGAGEWRGSLGITYHVGPGATRVHMKTDYDWATRPLYDVIATIPGSVDPDHWVIAGNHHDAWVNGADDPISGAVALMETARALAILQKQGWKPKRTIKIALWDGEEFGLLGSTEWAEKHQDELKKKAVAYLNSDSSAKGWLHVSGSHSLEDFAGEVASAVPQPDRARTWRKPRCIIPRRTMATRQRQRRIREEDELYHWRAGRGFGLCGVPRFSGCCQHERRFCWTDERRHLPFCLRFHLLVHAFFRRQFCGWKSAFAIHGDGFDAAGGFSSVAV